MKYNVNDEIKEITMKVWDGSQYSPDFFYDMETHRYNLDEDGIQHISAEEYAEIVNYWREEVETANDGSYSEQFGHWREYHSEPEELALFADEL